MQRCLWKALSSGLGILLLTTASLAHEHAPSAAPQEPQPKASEKAPRSAPPPVKTPKAKRDARADKAEQDETRLDKPGSDRSKIGPARGQQADEQPPAAKEPAKAPASSAGLQTVLLPWAGSVVTLVRKKKTSKDPPAQPAKPAAQTALPGPRVEQAASDAKTTARRQQGPTRSAAHMPTSPLLAATLAQPEGEAAPLQHEGAHRDTPEVLARWLLQDSRKMTVPVGIPFPVGVNPSGGGGTVTYKGTFELTTRPDASYTALRRGDPARRWGEPRISSRTARRPHP